MTRINPETLLSDVREHLKTYAFGRDHTLSKTALTRAVTGVTTDSAVRKVRQAVASLVIEHGAPICSSSSGTRGGYWWYDPEDDPAVFDEAYNTKISYAREIEKSARCLKDNVEDARIEHLRRKAEEEQPLGEPLQQELFDLGRAS